MRLGSVAALLALFAVGCASVTQAPGEAGTISVKEGPLREVDAATRNAVTVRVLPYVDARGVGNPRKIGVGGENIYGLRAPSGTDILLDKDAASVVTAAMKWRLKDAGYQVVEDGSARFAISGSVKELTYNIKARDEVSVSVATELKDLATGDILWSGIVDEKKERYPGVMGDSVRDVAGFLKIELGVVTEKTTSAINALLSARHPELFHVAPGTKPIAGVTVLAVPPVASGVPAAPQASGVFQGKGTLMIRTKPSRARIYVGDVYYGLSPLRLELEPGILEVRARLDRYKQATEKVSVRKGETTELELTLKR